MKKRYAMAAAAGVGLLMVAGGWWISRPSSNAAPVRTKQAAPAAPANLPHEKAFLETELGKKPGHAPVLLRLAQVEREMGQLAEARKHLEQAIKGSENLVEARIELSRVAYEMGDVNTALEQNRAVLRQDPRQTDALYNLGALSANLGNAAQARKYWQDAVAAGAGTASGKKSADALRTLDEQATAR